MKNIHISFIAIGIIVLVSCVNSPKTGNKQNQMPSYVLLETEDKTLIQFNNSIMNYLFNKSDNIVYETINVYNMFYEDDILEEVDDMVTFFYYGIKLHDKEKYDLYINTIKQSNIERLIYLFRIIETVDLESHLMNHEVIPVINDFYWTLYFSSGNTKYLDNVIDFINKYNNGTVKLHQYLTARAVLFSFIVNTKNYPTVLSYVINNQDISDEIKYHILNRTVDYSQNEAVEFIKMQVEKGIW
jgi:hypothetical protein